jgi:hypothetical protein
MQILDLSKRIFLEFFLIQKIEYFPTFNKLSANPKFRHNFDLFINISVKYQIDLLQADINSLWSIINYIYLKLQETSINKSFHSYFESKKPSKHLKLL